MAHLSAALDLGDKGLGFPFFGLILALSNFFVCLKSAGVRSACAPAVDCSTSFRYLTCIRRCCYALQHNSHNRRFAAIIPQTCAHRHSPLSRVSRSSHLSQPPSPLHQGEASAMSPPRSFPVTTTSGLTET